MAKAKLKAPALIIGPPHDRDEADELIFTLGGLQRDRVDLETAMNEALAEAKLEYEYLAKPLNEKIAALMAALQTFCEAHRVELLKGDSKTVKFGNGTVSWRARPASVTLRNVKKIIAWLQGNWFGTFFLRIKTEINKDAMLAHPEPAKLIPGVQIGSAGEDFVVKPFESKLEEVAP